MKNWCISKNYNLGISSLQTTNLDTMIEQYISRVRKCQQRRLVLLASFSFKPIMHFVSNKSVIHDVAKIKCAQNVYM